MSNLTSDQKLFVGIAKTWGLGIAITAILMWLAYLLIPVVFELTGFADELEAKNRISNEIKATSEISGTAVEAYIECINKETFLFPPEEKMECQVTALEQVLVIEGVEALPEARKALDKLLESFEKIEAKE